MIATLRLKLVSPCHCAAPGHPRGGLGTVDRNRLRFGQLAEQGRRQTARTGAQIQDPPGLATASAIGIDEIQHGLDQGLGIGPGGQNIGGDVEIDGPEAAGAEDLRQRLTRKPPGKHGLRRGTRIGRNRLVAAGQQAGRIQPRHPLHDHPRFKPRIRAGDVGQPGRQHPTQGVCVTAPGRAHAPVSSKAASRAA